MSNEFLDKVLLKFYFSSVSKQWNGIKHKLWKRNQRLTMPHRRYMNTSCSSPYDLFISFSIYDLLRLFWIFHSWDLLCVPYTLDWCPKLFFASINHIKLFWYWLKRFSALYWQSMTIVIVPIALLPVILMDDKPENRCLYVLLLVSLFWSTVALPLRMCSI